MIQAIRETNFTAYIETEASRIDKTVTSAHIRNLVKFINDLDGAVFYTYATTEVINNRYTSLAFTYGSSNVYTGKLKLVPAGYYKYEVYEVSWIGAVSVSSGTAPATETDILLPVANTKGVVQGLVAIGKLYLGEKSGSEEVSYTEYEEPAATNYIYYGQNGAVSSYSAEFDGLGTGVTPADIISFTQTAFGLATNTFSFSFWAKKDVSGTNMIIFGRKGAGGNSYLSLISLDGAASTMVIESDTNGQTATASITEDTNWHNYMVTTNGVSGTGNVITMYQDGVSLTVSYATKINTNMTIDALGGGGNIFRYDGLLFQAAIYNKVVDAASTTAIYNSGVPIPLQANAGDYDNAADLIHLWKFAEGSGTTAADTIGSLTGTLQDNAQFSSVTP